MKKFLLSLACVFGLTASAEVYTAVIDNPGSTVEKFADKDSGTSITEWDVAWNPVGFHFVTDKKNGGSYPSYFANTGDLRVYAKGTLTISCENVMTSISFKLSTAGLKRLPPITCDAGEVSAQSAGDTTVEWTGQAREVTFTVGEKANYGSEGASKAGQFDFDQITITCDSSIGDVVNVANVVFTPGSGVVIPGTAVTLSCETEGAVIHYAIDEGPDASSPIYTEPIIITDDCTIQAIAILNGVSSAVSTAEYTVDKPIESMAHAIYDLKNNDKFVAGFEPVVVYINGQYCYVYHALSQTFGLIYDKTASLNLKAGDVIAAGWSGKLSVYNHLRELVADDPSALVAKTTTEIPAPVEINADNYENLYTEGSMNTYVVVKNVRTFVEETNNLDMFGSADGCDYTFYNKFGLDIASGTFDIKGFITIYGKKVTGEDGKSTTEYIVQIYPVELVEAASSIKGDVNGDEAVNIGDVSALVDCILAGSEGAAYDVNNDGAVNIGDISALVDLILSGK